MSILSFLLTLDRNIQIGIWRAEAERELRRREVEALEKIAVIARESK